MSAAGVLEYHRHAVERGHLSRGENPEYPARMVFETDDGAAAGECNRPITYTHSATRRLQYAGRAAALLDVDKSWQSLVSRVLLSQTARAEAVTHVTEFQHVTITQQMLAHLFAVHIAPICAIHILDDDARRSDE
jgi:hypothetical protein